MVLEHPGWVRGKGSKKDVVRMIPVNRTRPEEDVGPLWKMEATEQAHAAAVNICWMSVQQRVLERVGLGSQVPRLYWPPRLSLV